ncbi:thioredoxin [Roseburia sp. MSJ-14]|uniref:thioredoxin n=1 Tax=Roseburia sp. MSJ-14 TaxID=2841514 RepID=UPI001C11D019|nr:thioredoxin [Roseburia sp. MSJ-14]MBU5472573.1 thioredoxin [Roseburia sp. MSJ-14]
MATITIKTDNFEEEVLKSEVPVLIDFWATWCGPCQMQGPVVEQAAEELKDIKVGKVNVDEEGALAQQFRVMSIPTLIVFKDGKEAGRAIGFQTLDEIKKLMA